MTKTPIKKTHRLEDIERFKIGSVINSGEALPNPQDFIGSLEYYGRKKAKHPKRILMTQSTELNIWDIEVTYK